MMNEDFSIANCSLSLKESWGMLTISEYIAGIIIAGFKCKESGYLFREEQTYILIVPEGFTSKKFNLWLVKQFLPMLPRNSRYYIIDARNIKEIDIKGKKLTGEKHE